MIRKTICFQDIITRLVVIVLNDNKIYIFVSCGRKSLRGIYQEWHVKSADGAHIHTYTLSARNILGCAIKKCYKEKFLRDG